MAGRLSRTEIQVGDEVKVIQQVDGYRTKFPKQLKLGEVYKVLTIVDDYFDGHTLIFEVNGERIACLPLGFDYQDNYNKRVRFEVVNNPNAKSYSI